MVEDYVLDKFLSRFEWTHVLPSELHLKVEHRDHPVRAPSDERLSKGIGEWDKSSTDRSVRRVKVVVNILLWAQAEL